MYRVRGPMWQVSLYNTSHVIKFSLDNTILTSVLIAFYLVKLSLREFNEISTNYIRSSIICIWNLSLFEPVSLWYLCPSWITLPFVSHSRSDEVLLDGHGTSYMRQTRWRDDESYSGTVVDRDWVSSRNLLWRCFQRSTKYGRLSSQFCSTYLYELVLSVSVMSLLLFVGPSCTYLSFFYNVRFVLYWFKVLSTIRHYTNPLKSPSYSK